MATKDNQGNWTFEPEEESQIEILARARVRADEIREGRAADREANKCDLCGKDKRQGEHGKGKCKKKAAGPGWE